MTRSKWFAGGAFLLSALACGGRAAESGGRESRAGGGSSNVDQLGGGGNRAISGSPSFFEESAGQGDGGTSGEAGLPEGGAEAGGSSGEAADPSIGGSFTGGAPGKFNSTCTEFCNSLTHPACPKVDGLTECAGNCELGLEAHGAACGKLGNLMLACLGGTVRRYSVGCIGGIWSAVQEDCLPEISAYQACQREHGGDPIPAPTTCSGSSIQPADGCSLAMTCPNGVSYSIICTEDAPAVSKCAFRWNGVTTNVTAKMTASEPYACEATLDAAIIPLLPK